MIHDTWRDRYSEACDKIDELNDTIVRLRAELAQFRPVVITSTTWDIDAKTDVILIDERCWVTIPFKVYVKDDHA
jgi:hypothetical protein